MSGNTHQVILKGGNTGIVSVPFTVPEDRATLVLVSGSQESYVVVQGTVANPSVDEDTPWVNIDHISGSGYLSVPKGIRGVRALVLAGENIGVQCSSVDSLSQNFTRDVSEDFLTQLEAARDAALKAAGEGVDNSKTLDALGSRVTAVEASASNNTREIGVLHATDDALRSDVDAGKTRADALDTRLVATESSITTMTALLSGNNDTYTNLTTRLSNAEGKLNTLSTVSERVTSVEGSIANVNTSMAGISNIIKGLSDGQTGLVSRVTQAEANIANLTASAGSGSQQLENRVNTLESLFNGFTSQNFQDMEQVTNRVNLLENQFNNLPDVRGIDWRLSQLESTVNTNSQWASGNITNLGNDVFKLYERTDTLTRDAKTLTDRVTANETNIKTNTDGLSSLKDRVTTLEGKAGGSGGITGPTTTVNRGVAVYGGTDGKTLGTASLLIQANGAIQNTNPASGNATPNACGTGAVDLQVYRSQATQVAKGDYSFLGGGQGNTARGDNGAIVGGVSNTVGAWGFIGGGQGNAATAPNSVVLGGTNNIATAYYGFIGGGQGNTTSAANSVVLGGTSNNSAHTSAATFGTFGLSKAPNSLTQGGGQFSVAGDNQVFRTILKTTVASGGATAVLTPDGTTNTKLTLISNDRWAIDGMVMAGTQNGALTAAWRVSGLVVKVGTGTAQFSTEGVTVSRLGSVGDTSNWVCDVVVSGSELRLRVTTPSGAPDARANAYLDILELVF